MSHDPIVYHGIRFSEIRVGATIAWQSTTSSPSRTGQVVAHHGDSLLAEPTPGREWTVRQAELEEMQQAAKDARS